MVALYSYIKQPEGIYIYIYIYMYILYVYLYVCIYTIMYTFVVCARSMTSSFAFYDGSADCAILRICKNKTVQKSFRTYLSSIRRLDHIHTKLIQGSA